MAAAHSGLEASVAQLSASVRDLVQVQRAEVAALGALDSLLRSILAAEPTPAAAASADPAPAPAPAQPRASVPAAAAAPAARPPAQPAPPPRRGANRAVRRPASASGAPEPKRRAPPAVATPRAASADVGGGSPAQPPEEDLGRRLQEQPAEHVARVAAAACRGSAAAADCAAAVAAARPDRAALAQGLCSAYVHGSSEELDALAAQLLQRSGRPEAVSAALLRAALQPLALRAPSEEDAAAARARARAVAAVCSADDADVLCFHAVAGMAGARLSIGRAQGGCPGAEGDPWGGALRRAGAHAQALLGMLDTTRGCRLMQLGSVFALVAEAVCRLTHSQLRGVPAGEKDRCPWAARAVAETLGSKTSLVGGDAMDAAPVSAPTLRKKVLGDIITPAAKRGAVRGDAVLALAALARLEDCGWTRDLVTDRRLQDSCPPAAQFAVVGALSTSWALNDSRTEEEGDYCYRSLKKIAAKARKVLGSPTMCCAATAAAALCAPAAGDAGSQEVAKLVRSVLATPLPCGEGVEGPPEWELPRLFVELVQHSAEHGPP
eukprot:TRINITY_DN4138_c1_g5_i1.p2 TRINITY_DN4138_c1_g5~~TRINITY_DN4138_c1_g5_i1.p2  ORF type:complete len:576 (+),score=164.26 TRINITY_DN4138_c1_g5_i1:76-1728(+)